MGIIIGYLIIGAMITLVLLWGHIVHDANGDARAACSLHTLFVCIILAAIWPSVIMEIIIKFVKGIFTSK